METSTLLYLFYLAKVCIQIAIYFIFLLHSLAESIPYLAAVVVLLAIIPIVHLVAYLIIQKPLLVAPTIGYICFRYEFCLFLGIMLNIDKSPNWCPLVPTNLTGTNYHILCARNAC